MAAPTIVGSVTLAEQSTGTSLAINVPAGAVVGEYLVACIVTSGGTSTAPAAFTRKPSSNNAGTAVSVYVDVRKVDGTETSSYTWTGITTGRTTGFMFRVSGADGTTQFDVTPSVGTNTGTGNTCVVASQTTVTANDLLISVVGGNAAVGLTWTPPSGMTTVSSSTGTGRGASLAKAVQVSAGATGTQTWSWSQTNLEMRAVMIAIRSAPPPLGPPFGIKVEAAFGANPSAAAGTWSWSDISAYVLGRNGNRATITRGRQDESSQAQPSALTIELNNSDGRFTPDNAAGANYPNVVLNLPIRVSINPGSGYVSRGIFFASSFLPSWDESKDFSTIVLTANGVLRRLRQGSKASRSALFRSVMARVPFAYWPLEDASGAAQAASAVGGNALVPTAATVALGAAGPAGAESAVDFTGGGLLQGGIAVSGLTSFRLVYAVQLTSTAAAVTPVTWTTSSGYTWSLSFDPTLGQYIIAVTDGGVVNVSTSTAAVSITDTSWHLVQVNLVQNGVFIDASVGVDGSAWSNQIGFVSGTLGNPTGIKVGSTGVHTFFLGHVALISPTTLNPEAASVLYGALGGYAGEVCSARVVRLCGEEGIQVSTVGTSTVTMSAQPTSDFGSALAECETTDGGILYDALDSTVGYLALPGRYNIASTMTIDNSDDELPRGFAPAKDDLLIRNDWTVTSNGTSAEYVDAASVAKVGVYDDSATVNVQSAAQLLDQASWRVHLGLVGGLRYPQIPIDLVVAPSLIPSWLGCDIGERITLKSLPAQHPAGDVDLVVVGYTESFDAVSWQVTANCAPYSPWVVGVWDTSRADSSSSTLASSITNASTTLSVATAIAADLWTTSGGDFPFNIICGGEVMQVTNITGASSPQSFTVTRGINGVSIAHGSGAEVHVYQPAVAAL